MKARFILVVVILTAASVFAQKEGIDFVNPFIGTGGHGHTYPGASLPFGMIQLSPDTDDKGWDWCSGYHYSDSTIMGFSHTHLSGTGIGDYGDILFMPVHGSSGFYAGSKYNPDSGYRSRFSHKNEYAEPGYYSVYLPDNKVRAELTVSERCGFHQYTFDQTERNGLIIDLNHGISDKTVESYIKIIGKNKIVGYRKSSGWAQNQAVYFAAAFLQPFKNYEIMKDSVLVVNVDSAKGKEIILKLNFNAMLQKRLLVKVGISFVSIEGAKRNLEREIPGWNFNEVKNMAKFLWRNELEKIYVSGGTYDEKVIFYTSLYHLFLAPNLFNDVDGNYLGMDGKIRKIKGRKMYTVFSLWDTYRAAHPLFALLQRERNADFVNSLVQKYKEANFLPVWELAGNETYTMIGYHSVPVIVDAYMKGIKDFDVKTAYEGMKSVAEGNYRGLEYYQKYGYIPEEFEGESVSKTLEYAYDDYCISLMAKELGKKEDYEKFSKRAKFYINLFDDSTGFFRPKRNGNWAYPFNPFEVTGDYTEANAWQYLFAVPQDVDGLIKLMGGEKNFVKRLDKLFSVKSTLEGRVQPDIAGLIGQYAHGNEPSHHIAYLYNYAQAPYKTAEQTRRIMSSMYFNAPDGLSGNEDCGQMSAWYVFSAMGFYPVTPGDDKYMIGSPIFDRIIINTAERSYFTIITMNNSEKNIYVNQAMLNGNEHYDSFLTFDQIMSGGILNLLMSEEKGEEDFGLEEGRPSISVSYPLLENPIILGGDKLFYDNKEISIITKNDTNKIFYSVNDSEFMEYSSPFTIEESSKILAFVKRGKMKSMNEFAEFVKIKTGYKVELKSDYSSEYPARGKNSLIDGIKGPKNFMDEAWLGYHGNDFEAVVDFGDEKEIDSVAVSFLQDQKKWIFFPEYVDVFVSTDNENFKKIGRIENKISKRTSESILKEFSTAIDGKARYIKVFAKNIGTCPAWHIGAGSRAWIFIDDISIGEKEPDKIK